jgi:hypothetical protein
MGLQLQAQSRQPGCRRKNLLNIFASLVTSPGLFFWNLIIRSFDKGKPVERRGRKAKDLKLHISAVMTAWLPKGDFIISLDHFECLYR